MKLPNSSRQYSGNTRYVVQMSSVFFDGCVREFNLLQTKMWVIPAPGTKNRVETLCHNLFNVSDIPLLIFAQEVVYGECMPCHGTPAVPQQHSQSTSSKYTPEVLLSCPFDVKVHFEGLFLM